MREKNKSNEPERAVSDFNLDDEFPDTRTTFYFDGEERWLRRDWAPQCSHKILLLGRCQGVEGHEGDHWCFAPNGSYHWSRDKDHLDYKQAASGMTPPTSEGYRTPLEMNSHYHLNHYEDQKVTEPEELDRLNRGDFQPEESVDRPCTEEEFKILRELGRIDETESSDSPGKSESRDKPE